MSFAVTPRGGVPAISMRSTSGTVIRTALVTIALAMSVVPTPKARHPSAPLCGVWESVPAISWPGRAYISAIIAWEMPSEPGPSGR